MTRLCIRTAVLLFLAAGLRTLAAPAVSLPTNGKIVRLLVTGDAGGTHSRLSAGMVAVHKKTPIDAIILLGDNFYPCGVTSTSDAEWSKITEHFHWLPVPIFAVLGNHDYGDPGEKGVKEKKCADSAVNPQAQVEATGIVPQWNLPARSYELHNALVDIFLIDTEPIALGWKTSYFGSSTGDEVLQWLTSQLPQSRAPWRIVAGHHLIYSSGAHGNGAAADSRSMRKRLLPLLGAQKVDLYMSGHDHEMELIGNLRAHQTLFLLSGAGSDIGPTTARTRAEEPPTIWPEKPGAQFYGFAVLELTATRMTITFYDATGKTRSQPFVVEK